MHMAWEWVTSGGTVVVALAGIGATLRTAAQGRKHAEHLASEEQRRAHQEMARRERLKVYADALAHAVDQERKLNAVWATDGERGYDMSPRPPGAPLSLASMDAVTVQMSLLADEQAAQAWAKFVSAWEEMHWWAEVVHSGDPREEAPPELTTELRRSIDRLKQASRQSIQ